MSVLILADDVDSTADVVVGGLMERSVAVHRMNTAWFPGQLSMSAQQRGGRWEGQIRTPGQIIDLEDVTAVWYRSPRAYQFPAELSAAERAHATLEAKYGIGGVLASLPVLWVNHPSRLADAAYKPLQLALADRCGLRVPDTLLTNEPEVVREFVAQGPTVTKLLGSNTIAEEGLRKLSYTRLVDDAELTDLRGIDVTTHLFQRWVPKAHEVRMAVIGDHITAAAIHAGTPETYVDFRVDYDRLSYELVDPPSETIAAVRRLMADLGLVYGALDFVVEPSGEWVMLEINAGGQVLWLEHESGAPLTDQLADLLAKGTP